VARRARIDLSRVAASALDAAVNGEQPRRGRFSGVRAVAAGAVLAAAAQVVVRKAPTARIPGLPQMPDLSELGDSVRDRLAERGWIEDEAPVDEDFEDEAPVDEAPVDEAPVDEDFEDEEEPEDERDEDEPEDDDFDDDTDGDDDDRGPDAEGEDDWDEEDEDEEPDDEDEESDFDDEPEAVNGNGRSRETARSVVDPVARPPEPPPDAEESEKTAEVASGQE